MAKVLFISREDVVKKTSLGGNVDSDKFLQFIEQAQDIYILEYLGTDLYNKLVTLIDTDSLTGNYLTLLTDYIKPMLIHYAVAQYLPFSAYTIANGGIYKHSSENSETASKNEVDYLSNLELQKATKYTERFIKYMSYNASVMFPEYYTNTNDDVNPNKKKGIINWAI